MDDAEAHALVQRACAARSSTSPDDGDSHVVQCSSLLGSVAAGAGPTSAHARQIQRLWGGMGAVYEVTAVGGDGISVNLVIKRVALPASGGALSLGDRRKKKSYQCESCFYETLAPELRAAGCSVPAGLLVERHDDGAVTIVMSKLPGSSRSLGEVEMAAVVAFLARMHSHTWGSRADAAVAKGLQSQGCYWYLDTRPDEWQSMPATGWEGRLRRAAQALDQRLKDDPYQCIVHGDLKSDNMTFSESGEVSLCDFQYSGRACPMKDLAYLTLCCAANEGCSRTASDKYLTMYHSLLAENLAARAEAAPQVDRLRAGLSLAGIPPQR
eukprot:COSAG02_NODE_4244_length_5593_cov_2.391518_5_plen_326_part_00